MRGFSPLFQPRRERGLFPQWQNPLFRAGSGVRIRLRSPRVFSVSLLHGSFLQSCRGRINPGVTDCQPASTQPNPTPAQPSASTRDCQAGLLLTGEHSCTFSALRHKGTRQLQTGSQLHSERSLTEHQQTGHSPQALTSRLCLSYFSVFFISFLPQGLTLYKVKSIALAILFLDKQNSFSSGII